MIPLSLGDIASAVDGRLVHIDPDVIVSAPATVDSRQVMPGGLFVAVPGEHVDGHDFAREAVQRGASAVLATRELAVPAVVVGDAVRALGQIAAHVRAQLPRCTVVGLTGSQGKTGTKDLLAGVLGHRGAVVAPIESYNNELGVPLTVLRADPSTDFLVIEMGARAGGHLRYLADIARPSVGLVLNVGVAHLGEFGSVEAIAAAKAELIEGLPADGIAVLNADQPLVASMATRTRSRVVTFGESPADVRVRDLQLDRQGRPSFELETAEGRTSIALPLLGAHQAINAAAAAAVALQLGVSLTDVGQLLSAAKPMSRWRMEQHRRDDNVLIVNDAYNANPDSMRAALETLSVLGRGGAGTVAVLGEMRELGATSTAEHELIGRLVVRLGVDRLIVVGAGAEHIQLGARLEGASDDRTVLVADPAAASAYLAEHLRPGEIVLVKASRAVGLERVATALLAREGDNPASGAAHSADPSAAPADGPPGGLTR